MTKVDFETYVYLMGKIFPPDASEKTILKIKSLLEDYYVTVLDGQSDYFRKTIDRNLTYIEAIRKGTLKKRYNPTPDTLKIFIGYQSNRTEDLISLDDFGQRFEKEVQAYISENPLNEKVLAVVFPKLPEKLVGIENRISKIENFIAANDGFIDNLLSSKNNTKSLKAKYSNEKLSLDFLNFLQQELLETKKQYQRAKLLYKRLGSVGLFIVPIKFALFEENDILQEFFGEDLIDNDIWDDLL